MTRTLGAAVAAFLVLSVCCAPATAADGPRVKTFDDGSAAVTLQGGLTVVLDRTVTSAVDSRSQGAGSLDRVIARHAADSRVRARAICAYARSLGGARVRGGQACHDRRDDAPAPDSSTRTAPLQAGLDGQARKTAREPARSDSRHTTGRATTAARDQAQAVRGRAAPNAQPMRRPRGTSAPRRRPAAESAPRRSAQRERPRAVEGIARRPRKSRRAAGRARIAGIAGAGGSRLPGTGTNLPQPAGALVSSSLSTTVVGPDPVASPSGFTLR